MRRPFLFNVGFISTGCFLIRNPHLGGRCPSNKNKAVEVELEEDLHSLDGLSGGSDR